MISIFHQDDAETHRAFQTWRKAHVDGFHMTERALGRFVIHYAQDKRENPHGRGCIHQGGSDNDYLDDKNSCYTAARKVCSENLEDLIAWANEHRYETRNCKHCDTTRFPFPPITPLTTFRLADEVLPSLGLLEGSTCRVEVNAYERNAIARAECIKRYGATCVVCDFSFGMTYGSLAEGFIHVHHVKPLSEIGQEYHVDPVVDLRPVCPNCHAVIHLGDACRTIDEVRRLLGRDPLPQTAARAPRTE